MALTLKQQLTALYDAAFNRPPDEAGLARSDITKNSN
jgi:hypothetical protein